MSCHEGNLGRVDFITENEYDLFVRPDTCNPRARFWFHFSVSNVQRGQRVLFNVVNLGRSRCVNQIMARLIEQCSNCFGGCLWWHLLFKVPFSEWNDPCGQVDLKAKVAEAETQPGLLLHLP